VPGWPAQGVQLGRVPAVKVGAVEQVVAVEFNEVLVVTFALIDAEMLADVVMVDNVEVEVMDADVETTDEELLVETTEELLLETTEEELLLETTDEELLLETTDELVEVMDGATEEELELEVVDEATVEEDVTQPLICLPPQTPELALAAPTAFFR
jgi:hypothetical protein